MKHNVRVPISQGIQEANRPTYV